MIVKSYHISWSEADKVCCASFHNKDFAEQKYKELKNNAKIFNLTFRDTSYDISESPYIKLTKQQLY